MELKPEQKAMLNIVKDIKDLKIEKHIRPNKVKDVEELKLGKDAMLSTMEDVEGLKVAKETKLKESKGCEGIKLMESIKELQLKLTKLESNLNEVLHSTILVSNIISTCIIAFYVHWQIAC